MIFLLYSLIVSLCWIGMVLFLIFRLKDIRQIDGLKPSGNKPSVALIVAIRNEEDDLEKALTSIFNIDYEDLKIVLINDRSTDRTPAILQQALTKDRRLTIHHIEELPEGWLGKNNAMYQGYLQSNEEWLLFADADIEFHPETIDRAIGYALEQHLDHLTILPDVKSRSPLLNSVLSTFSIMLMMHLKPWDAKNPKSKASIGIGAFNLLRREAYEKVGTHAVIKERPDDDLQLGRLVKTSGMRQDVLGGRGFIKLEWYRNLRQFRDGLMKNSFAISNYDFKIALKNALMVLVCFALPIPLMLIFGSSGIRIMAVIVLAFQILYMKLIWTSRWWHAFMIPYASLLMSWITVKSAWITVRQGGIYWRDHFYPMNTLKGK